MLSTWIGSETEYSLVFLPKPSGDSSRTPDKSVLFDCLLKSMKTKFVLANGANTANYIPSFFIENGGCFYFERDPNSMINGLCEFATPECSYPLQHLSYKRSQQKMLIQALPLANDFLNKMDYHGEIKIIKNSRDYAGNVYGEQENYQIEAKPSFHYFLYCVLAVASFLPVLVFYFAFNLLALLILTPIVIIQIIKLSRQKKRIENNEDMEQRINIALQPYLRLAVRVQDIVFSPLFYPLAKSVEYAYIKPYATLLSAHLISRIIYTGCGTLEKGKFFLSEKPLVIDQVIRQFLTLKVRPIFETHNFFKNYIRTLFLVDPIAFREVFKRSQRLQINLSDSNMCDVSDYLKVASTYLLITMHKSGFQARLPQLLHPLKALTTINSDPSLSVTVDTSLGPLTALEIQQRYLAAAKDYVTSQNVMIAEYRDIIKLWENTLTHLNTNPSQLFGQVDWISKKLLIEQGSFSLTSDSARKIDLKYHQLEDGYFEQLKTSGNTVRLVADEDIDSAIYQAPDTRAALRSKLIRESINQPGKIIVYWQQVKQKQKGKLKANVIDLDKYRH